jgi:hypothetical protein
MHGRSRASLFAGLLLFLFFLALYLWLLPGHLQRDSWLVNYLVVKSLEAPPGPSHPGLYYYSHVFQNPLDYLLGRLCLWIDPGADLLRVFQVLSVLFSVSALLLAFLVFLRLGVNTLPAFLSVFFIGAGYGFWAWSGQLKAYAAGYFFLMLALASYLCFRGIWRLFLCALFSALAVGFSFATYPFLGVMAVFMLFQPGPAAGRLKDASVYVLATLSLVFLFFFGIYSFIFGRLSPGSPGGWSLLGLLPWTDMGAFMRDGSVRWEGLGVFRNTVFAVLSPELGGRWLSIPLFGSMAAVFILLPAADFRRFLSEWRNELLLAASWIVIFLAAFFFVDPVNSFLYVIFFGAALFFGIVCTSFPRWNLLLLLLSGLLLLGNLGEAARLKGPDPSAEKAAGLEKVLRRGDVFISGFSGDYPEYDPALLSYFSMDLLELSKGEVEALSKGVLPPPLEARMEGLLGSGKRIFISGEKVRLALENSGRSEEMFWRALGKRHPVLRAFEAPFGPDGSGELYLRIGK